MSRSLLIFFFAAASALAQFGRLVPAFPETLRRFLDLSNTQVDAISRLNGDYRRKVSEKQDRMNQVRGEIAEETQKDILDPMALGLRYVEIEAIQRDLRDQLTNVRLLIRQTLNDAQRAKLKALDDAIKLQPVIGEAQCENMLEPQIFGALGVRPASGIPTGLAKR